MVRERENRKGVKAINLPPVTYFLHLLKVLQPSQNSAINWRSRRDQASLVWYTLTLLPVRPPKSETTCAVVWVPSEVFWLHQKWVWALNDEN